MSTDRLTEAERRRLLTELVDRASSDGTEATRENLTDEELRERDILELMADYPKLSHDDAGDIIDKAAAAVPPEQEDDDE